MNVPAQNIKYWETNTFSVGRYMTLGRVTKFDQKFPLSKVYIVQLGTVLDIQEQILG